MTFSDFSRNFRARVAYSQLSRTVRMIDDEQARERVLEAMDALWLAMSETDREQFPSKNRGT